MPARAETTAKGVPAMAETAATPGVPLKARTAATPGVPAIAETPENARNRDANATKNIFISIVDIDSNSNVVGITKNASKRRDAGQEHLQQRGRQQKLRRDQKIRDVFNCRDACNNRDACNSRR